MACVALLLGRCIVIKLCWCPGDGVVAGFAGVVGNHVGGGFAGGGNAVVAFEAAVYNACMIKHADFPRH